MYQITGFLKLAELDNYQEGCDPSTSQLFEVNTRITAKTTAELIKECQEFLGVGPDGTEINACDEDGRIDFQRMENGQGNKPTKAQLSAWKRGKVDLYAVTYTCYVQKVESVRL